MLPGQPPQYAGLLDHLEVFSLNCINTASLYEVKSAKIYKKLKATLPTLRFERLQLDLPWDSVWPRLLSSGLNPLAATVSFP
jgi:hypothetical protein